MELFFDLENNPDIISCIDVIINGKINKHLRHKFCSCNVVLDSGNTITSCSVNQICKRAYVCYLINNTPRYCTD